MKRSSIINKTNKKNITPNPTVKKLNLNSFERYMEEDLKYGKNRMTALNIPKFDICANKNPVEVKMFIRPICSVDKIKTNKTPLFIYPKTKPKYDKIILDKESF
jgi:hypothetical protein